MKPFDSVVPTIDELEAMARERAGLTDFGDTAYREGFAVLSDALRREARLSGQGRASCTEHLTRRLVTRLKMTAFLRDHPSVESSDVALPIVIVSLGRTGTTLLHSLLAQDERVRTLQAWEASDPLPPPEPGTYDMDPRRQEQAFAAAVSVNAMPQLPAMLLSAAEQLPAEDSELLGVAGRDLKATVFWRVPSYREWLKTCDMQHAYLEHRTLLAILQCRMPRRPWVLKDASHLLGLDALVAIYPGATLVAIHRDPREIVGSSASLASRLRTMYSDEVSAIDCGLDTLGLVADCAHLYEDFRMRRPETCFVDIEYGALLKDPISAIRRIYATTDLELSSEVERDMLTWISRHPQGRHGQHRYALADFGLTEADVESRLGWYRDRFCDQAAP